MGTKHGIWFDLRRHLSIHKQVIKNYLWLIKSGETEYRTGAIKKDGTHYLTHEIKFHTTNGYLVEVFKSTIVSKKASPELGLTYEFGYNCIQEDGDYKLQYHSAHSSAFNPKSPWHHVPHRHEFIGNTQKVDVYLYDDRPKDQRQKKYKWSGGKVELNYLDHQDWPFVSEFLDEVSNLN